MPSAWLSDFRPFIQASIRSQLTSSCFRFDPWRRSCCLLMLVLAFSAPVGVAHPVLLIFSARMGGLVRVSFVRDRSRSEAAARAYAGRHIDLARSQKDVRLRVR